MTEAVDWSLAERVGTRLARRGPDLDPGVAARLSDDLTELTATAERLVEEHTGLVSSAGPARAKVVDRSHWVQANIAAFQRLLAPATERISAQLAGARSTGPIAVARSITGLEVGSMLGWMSGRVLGQYDLLVVDEASGTDGDWVYYVGPNVVAIERRFGFPAREFRLWLALHEVTHRAQFTGVPWMREHYLGLVSELVGSVDPDPQRFVEGVRAAVASLRRTDAPNPLDDGGLAALFASPTQRATLKQIGGVMSLLEGHGDATMNRAAAGAVPSAPRFARVLGERRQNRPGPARVVQRLAGFEAKLAQYEAGERFIEHIEGALGERAVDRCWERAEHLPTLDEIRDPAAWLARVCAPTAA